MESLENLKVGDKVFYDSRSTIRICTIARLTKTQIILSNKERFRKKDGRLVGGDNMWSITMIRLLIPERIERVALLKLRKKAIRLRKDIVIPSDKKTLEKFVIALKPFVELKI